MTLLARLQQFGLAKETTAGTYLAPVRSHPISAPKPEDIITPLRDEALKGNDAILQGIYGGPAHSAFDYTIPNLYVDVLGDYLRAILGPDTVTPGVSTTLSSAPAQGATSISVAATIPANSIIQIDTGVKTEYAKTGTPSGAGPYTIPLTAVANPVTGTSTGLAFGTHLSGATVVSQTTHTFAQDNRAAAIPTYSLTQNNKIDTRGYPGSVLTDFAVKIDPKGSVSGDAKWLGQPSGVQSAFTAAYTSAQPFIGWQWTLTLNGVASTRATNGEWDFKRASEPIESSDGTQGPREIWAGALELDYKMKAIFENNLDYTQFVGYTEIPIVSTLTQGLSFSGSVLTLTSTAQRFTKFAADYGSNYLMADIEASARFNSTDNGLGTVQLLNFVTTQY